MGSTSYHQMRTYTGNCPALSGTMEENLVPRSTGPGQVETNRRLEIFLMCVFSWVIKREKQALSGLKQTPIQFTSSYWVLAVAQSSEAVGKFEAAGV